MSDNRDKIFDFANLIKNQLNFYLFFIGCMHMKLFHDTIYFQIALRFSFQIVLFISKCMIYALKYEGVLIGLIAQLVTCQSASRDAGAL